MTVQDATASSSGYFDEFMWMGGMLGERLEMYLIKTCIATHWH